MLVNEEHELLKKVTPHINDPLMFDVMALLKYYEVKAVEKLIDCSDVDVKTLQGEIKSLRRVQSRLRGKPVAS